MTAERIRRMAVVLLVYLLVAWFALQVAEWLRGVLALPPIFRSLVTGLILAGIPVSILVAWHYPQVGVSEAADPQSSSHQVKSGER